MNKAILVIDMPANCRKCMYFVLGESNNFCSVTKYAVFDGKSIPYYCPLKPIPEKYNMIGIQYSPDHNGNFKRGYNACIEEILGE